MGTDVPNLESTVAAENARLRARIDSLEGELTGMRARESRGTRSEADRLSSDIPNQVADEASRVFRALSHAFVEQLRATADVVSAVADEAFRVREDRSASRTSTRGDRVSATAGESTSTRAGSIGNDVASVVNTAVETSLNVTGRVIDRLSGAYRESR